MRFGEDADGPPDFVAARDHVLDSVLAFSRALRNSGARVPANASLDATRALVQVGFEDRERVRAAMSATLVTRKEDLPVFERLFPAFWQRLDASTGAIDAENPFTQVSGGLAVPDYDASQAQQEPPAPADEDDGDDEKGTRTIETTVEPTAQEREVELDEDGEDPSTSVYSPSGRSEPVTGGLPLLGREDDLDAPMSQLTGALSSLRGRRWGKSGDERVDVRRALRGSFGTGGTVVSVPTHAKKRSAVKALLLVDVSQSVLDTIDRGFLLRFLRRASEEWRSVRVFFFDTSALDVTDAFRAPTPESALEALERAEAAWGGGTRIGRAVETVQREHPDAVDRDTTTIVISDGLEVGEIERLERGMSWLSARSAAVLWCNPLAASPEYEPTCRGMAASLPYVDGLFAFTGPDDVAEMARQLAQRGTSGAIGYEYDARQRA